MTDTISLDLLSSRLYGVIAISLYQSYQPQMSPPYSQVGRCQRKESCHLLEDH